MACHSKRRGFIARLATRATYRAGWRCLLALLAVGIASSYLHAEPAPIQLGKGVSLHTWFTWPNGAHEDGTFDWPPFDKPDGALDGGELKRLRAAGFDFVRLTVDPAPFIVFKNRNDELLRLMRVALNNIRAAGLKVILDIHPKTNDSYPWASTKLLNEPEKRRALMAVEAKLARFADDLGPDTVLLELINEPDVRCPADKRQWPQSIADLYKAARGASARVTLVVPLVCSERQTAFSNVPPTVIAERTLFTFHYYDPYLFTAQGQKGDIAEAFSGLHYPADAANTQATDQNLTKRIANDQPALHKAQERLREYADTYETITPTDRAIVEEAHAADTAHVPHSRVLLGEFSVNRLRPDGTGADLPSYRRWLRQIRTDAEKIGFPWCFWAYSGGDGMILVNDDRNRTLNTDALCALGLEHDKGQCAR